MQNCLNYSQKVANSENFWALYWYKHWQEESHSFARMHLSAYLQEPERQVWEAVANLYNRERQNQLTQPTPECTKEKIEQWLTQAAIYVRAYLYPPVNSLNLVISEDDATITFDLPDLSSDSLIAEMIAAEDVQNQQKQQSQIQTILLKALQKLDIKTQEILNWSLD
ncbi:hypothetical protein [Nostoc flagelliforme]|uniref:hypothetical protein n=1 Tax=Nostoc flagelliforme TaxID=1306274 RepID=UPI0030DCA6B8